MGNRRSIKEKASTKHETGDLGTWEKEPPTDHIVDHEDAELDDVFSDFPQNEACIELFRTNAQGGRPAFLEQIAPAMFSLAYVTENYGGGRYIAKGKYKDGSRVRMPFDIEGAPLPVKRKIPEGGTPTVQPIGPAPVERVIEQTGGNDLQAALLGVMKSMIGEMRGSEMQMLEKMRVYKELFAPAGSQQQAPVDQAINMLMKGVELGSINGGGDGSNLWLMGLKELKEPLTKLMETIQTAMIAGRQPTNVTPRPAVAGPVPAQPAPAQAAPVQPTPTEGDPMLAMVKMFLPALINGATRNADPDMYVDFILDQCPASAYDSLRLFLMKDGCLDELATIEPGIRFQQEWWVNLRAGLLDSLNEQLGHAIRPIQSTEGQHPSASAPTDSDNLS